MITAEISITPVGTCSTSISEFVAESEKILQKYTDLEYNLTSMATEISGNNIDEIFEEMKEMHAAQLKKGAKRLITTIRIDDRRDSESTMNEKIMSVKAKL